MRKLFVALALTLLVACSGDGPTGAGGDISGTYNLSTVNGIALPYLLQESGPRVEVFSDSYILGTAGKFIQSTSFRVTSGDTVTFEIFPDSGSYTVQGTAVLFNFADNSTLSATLGTGALSFSSGGLATVYLKQ